MHLTTWARPWRPALISVLLLCGCGGAASTPQALSLEGGRHVNREVPAYAHATYRSSAGGTSYDDGGAESGRSMSWFFETDQPHAEVIAFYEQALPNAEKRVDGSETVFTWKPAGGRAGDEMTIIVSPGEIQVCEAMDTR